MAKRISEHHEPSQDKAVRFLLDLVKKSDLSDDAAVELFVDSETVIDNYQASVQEQSDNLPSSEDIGIACFWLLFLTNAFKPGIYFDLVVRFLSSSNSISLYSSLDAVLELRQHAVSALEKMARPLEAASSSNDVPF